MAKAVAKCRCKICGKDFEATAVRCNRADADSWEKWAASHFSQCPKCYKERRRSAEAQKPFEIVMRVNVFHPAIVMVAGGNTLPHKEDLKAAGYRWDYEPTTGLLGDLSTKEPCHVWSKTIRLNRVLDWRPAYTSLIDEARDLGAKLKNGIAGQDLVGLRDILGKRESKTVEMEKEIATLVEPVRPEWIPDGHWNGKIYGNVRRGYCIYINGKKVDLTADQCEELNKYDLTQKEYTEKLQKIKDKYSLTAE
nr:MAG TPA: pepsin inhibitor [Caudoviricetes sp.]